MSQVERVRGIWLARIPLIVFLFLCLFASGIGAVFASVLIGFVWAVTDYNGPPSWPEWTTFGIGLILPIVFLVHLRRSIRSRNKPKSAQIEISNLGTPISEPKTQSEQSPTIASVEEDVSKVVTAVGTGRPDIDPIARIDEWWDKNNVSDRVSSALTSDSAKTNEFISKPQDQAAAAKTATDKATLDQATAEDESLTQKNDVVDQLAKFAELRTNGTLTEDEFRELKANLIGPSPFKQSSTNDYIKQLRSLRDKGDITDDEFYSKVLASLSNSSSA